MSFTDFAMKIKLIAEELNATREEEAIIIGKETVAMIRRRVQNEKVDSTGSPFGQYSQAKMPQWFFYGKSNSAGADKELRDGDWFVSYADFREINGLDSGDIDFTFSGDMWKNTGVTEVESADGSTTVYLGGQTDRAAQIYEWQEPRYGRILEPNEEEIQFVNEAHLERINGIIQKYL